MPGWKKNRHHLGVLNLLFGQMTINSKYLPRSFKCVASAECYDGNFGLRVVSWFHVNPQEEIVNKV